MKTILLMRHAKSDWGAQYATDFERPLNARGQRDAPIMAAFLASHDLLPELIVSSPAERAKLTAETVAKERSFDGELRFDRRIYLASPDMLIEVIRELPEEVETAMLVGHNPGMEDLILRLCGGNVRMPTAAVAGLRMYADVWADVRGGDAYMQWLVKPKILR
jgi:phosphohistidine phosphatase